MITILYAGNYKAADGILISLLSMVKHTDAPLNVICLTMDLSEMNENFRPISKSFSAYMDGILKSKNPNSKFTAADMTEEFKKNLSNSVNLNNRFTPYTMLRLLADKMDLPDKFIYLDADTVINRDISLLFDIDLEDNELGVVKDAYTLNPKYFNAGVLLVNFNACKKSALFERAREIVNNKRLLYIDQTALNKVCSKRIMLSDIFNSKNVYYPDIVVHHFCDVRKYFFHRIKPWEVDLVKEKTDVYNDVLDDYSLRKNQKQWEY